MPKEENTTWIVIAAALLSGLVVWLINFVWEVCKGKKRNKNILDYLGFEMQNNIEYAKHNVDCIEKYENKTAEAVNFLVFENKAARDYMANEGKKENSELIKNVAHFIVVVEHVNTILRDYERGLKSPEIKDYCIGEEKDSVEGNAKKILNQLKG
ncbi:MAG TPA: hypothetical protein VG603_11965 [Chitinophagales bacterium]|nr:hypothetical protein [Chitinophagales bacterium]